MSKVLFNLSGHPLPDGTPTTGYSQVIDIKIPNIEMGDEQSILTSVIDLVNEMIDNSSELIIEQGNYDLIPPGMAPISLVLISILHGITGHFPNIRFIYKSNDGFKLAGFALKLQDLRINARELRKSNDPIAFFRGGGS